jgi:hypothetical protein
MHGEDDMDAVEILRSPPAPRGLLIGPLILAGVIGLIALLPVPWFIRLVAVFLALLVLWVALFFSLPPPWLEMDDKGLTVRRRIGRPHRIAWAEIEGFEPGRTPPPGMGWRILIFVPLFILAIATSAGHLDSGVTDTSRPAIGWRRRGSARTRPDGWIIDAYGLSQEELLGRLKHRLESYRAEARTL